MQKKDHVDIVDRLPMKTVEEGEDMIAEMTIKAVGDAEAEAEAVSIVVDMTMMTREGGNKQ